MRTLRASGLLFALSVLIATALLPLRASAQGADGAVLPGNPICQKYAGALLPEELAEYRKSCLPRQMDERPLRAAAVGTCGNFNLADKELTLQLQAACVNDIMDNYAYAASLRKYNADLYQWQHKASDDMRILVWVVVLAGILMAIYQLVIVMQIELWRARRPGNAAPGGAPAPATTSQQLELGLGKIQITSSIVGVVVLVISIAFLYLYLTEVYTIKPPV